MNVTDEGEMDPETGRGGGRGKKHETCTAAFGGHRFRTYCFSIVALWIRYYEDILTSV